MEAIVILAGGAGTRLWPASTSETPKQFLSFEGDMSLLRLTAERGLAVNPDAQIVVVTHRDYIGATVNSLQDLAAGGAKITVLPEPEGRNTAPAIVFAALYLEKRLPETARLLVLSADHLIRPVEAFVSCVTQAAELGGLGYIAIFGIPPQNANTGYGYIEAGEALAPGFRVKSFREKPSPDLAARYVADGGYYWNSGMFLFSLKTLNEEFSSHAPQIYSPFRRIREAVSREEGRTVSGVHIWGEGEEIVSVYKELPSISVDYAVMEKSAKAAMVRSEFEWNDVGSWDEASRLYPSQAPALFVSETGGAPAGGNWVFSDIPVALCGVEDLIVVIKAGRALVLKKGSSQLVREAAQVLGKRS
ncbi:MAG: mannose-1-phosphate guanylyltransferase [Spirochaetales bacterium]|jgi:mannose-1-phosphate guanylyltransferase/mannose-6-phosphate isomerase|nr:mannose-1-phosphate guanylyltransferase [Spirochaetales bacterium]